MGIVTSTFVRQLRVTPDVSPAVVRIVSRIGELIVMECIRRMLLPPASENSTMRRIREQASHGKDGRKSSPHTGPRVTEEEFCAAKVRLEYSEDHLHFAICGMPGSGKSSLVNAFRGVKGSSPDAARVGIVETTTTIQRCPDPRQGVPYNRFVWYDVPGAGTLKIPSQQYFITQGLFIFDFVILVYDARFTEIDADMLRNCREFDIPAFIVRSKANQHIRNMMDEDDNLTFSDAREKYIEETRQNLTANLKDCGLYDSSSRCYIVSNVCMYGLVNSFEANSDGTAPQLQSHHEFYIDEEQLLIDLLKAADERRYTEPAQANPAAAGA